VRFTASDECGNEASCTSSITVLDSPPEIQICGDEEVCLWPSNHKYVCFENFKNTVRVSDTCGTASPVLEVLCESSQCDDAPCPEHPDENGDGKTVNDCIYDPDTDTLCARAERAGNKKEGRYYSVTVIASDDCGATDPTLVLTVHVPHSQKDKGDCISPNEK